MSQPSPYLGRFVSFLLLAIIVPTAYMAATPIFVNHAPNATADSYTLHNNGNIGSLLTNDSDPDPSDTLIAVLVTTPSFGSVSNNGGGNFFYSRSSSTWTGTDSFTYRTCDNGSPTLCSSSATVTINVTNQAPTVVNDVYSVHGQTIIGAFKANDSDPEGDALTYTQLTSPSHGSLAVVSQADMPRYTPNYGFIGTDTFTYKVCDSFNACSASATVFIHVNDMSPIANADYFIVHGSSIIGPMKGNDYDPEGDTIGSLSLISGASHGSVYGLANPPYASDYKQYVPNGGFTGTDSWQYQVCDSLGACATATVYILVLPGAGPTIKVPYACCPTDPGILGMFNPGNGGLPRLTGGPTGTAGPSHGDPVNLASGREVYAPQADLTVSNPTGPAVVWSRSYSGDQALSEVSGYGSPGLTRGWVHNYDISLQSTSGSWSALSLRYPNGATETLTPQLNGSGQPTGAFTTVAGAPYIVTGVSGSPTGTWQSVSITWNDQTQWRFVQLSGTTYALNKITNRTGQSLSFAWNGNRALTTVTDDSSSSVLLTLAYDANGKLTTATDIYDRQVSYSFDPGSSSTPNVLQSVSQVVTSGTSSPPARWTYTYTSDKGQQLNSITVPRPTGTGTSAATINYNSTGKVTSLVDGNGNQRVYTYNTSDTQIQIKDAANNVALAWTQKFNSSGLDTGTTNATSHSTTIAYTDFNNPLKPTSVIDRNGQETTYEYDQFGNVTEMITPRGLSVTYTWDYSDFALGRLVSVQEGGKLATTFSYYEPSGLLGTITRPEPNNGASITTTTFTYDSLGNVLTVVAPGNDADSTITTALNYTTDGAYSQSAKLGQPLTITDNLNHVTHLRYDSQGRRTSVTDALGNETIFTYNLVGQLLTTTFPATGQTGSGNSHSTNAYLYTGGPLTSLTFYDEDNTQVRQVTQAFGLEGESLSVGGSTAPTTSTYDALYRLKTLKDGNNNTTTYTYNSIGLVSSITMPGSEVTQFTSYDDAGNLLQRIDGNGVTTNYVYDDPESLLTDIEYPASTSLNVHLEYDSYGRRELMEDATGTHEYTYGNLDELLSVTTTYTGLSAKTISYTYYPDGNRETMTTPAGTFNYSFDAVGRAASMTNPFSETTSWIYQNNNWLQRQTLHNGATADYTYNARGQLTRLLNKIGSTTISDYSLTYDGSGNRSSVVASGLGTSSLNGTTTFTYNTKNELLEELTSRYGGYTHDFDYDTAGNPTTFLGLTKTYNSNNQQTGTGFAYDANGNPTSYNGVSLSFDPDNRLTSAGSALTAGYTGDGLRAWKQAGSTTTHFLYDGSNPVVELNSSGAVIATNTFTSQGLISRRVSSVSVLYVFDSEGNVAQRTDSSASVLSEHVFDAHGSSLNTTLTEPFGYRAKFGYYTDNETSLQLLTNRYYDPATGRFLTRDPIGYAGGINLYSYVGNNATNLIDPIGLNPASLALPALGGGAVAAGAGGLAAPVAAVAGVGVTTFIIFYPFGEWTAEQEWNPFTHPSIPIPPPICMADGKREPKIWRKPPPPPGTPSEKEDDCQQKFARELVWCFAAYSDPYHLTACEKNAETNLWRCRNGQAPQPYPPVK
jgi:RHS repeat-associated protein